MATINNLNIIQLLKVELEKEVKNVVTEELVKNELLSYEKRLREMIKSIVEKVSFSKIESVKDVMRIREELHVFLRWDDEQETQVTRRI